MTIYKRFLLLFLGFIALMTFLLSRDHATVKSTRIWRHTSQKPGLDEITMNNNNDNNDKEGRVLPQQILKSANPHLTAEETTRFDNISPFRPGKVKPPGSNYTKAVIIGHISSEDVSWLDDDASFPPNVAKFIYNADPPSHRASSRHSRTQDLSLPQPKGHEAMVYLTYIIDHYTSLADINIFMHAHQLAWHNDEMLNHDAVEVISRLSAERVTREGYVNLRCNWKPGCPEYLYPRSGKVDDEKREEGAMADAWAVLFPGEEVPEVMAAPCCAQFAVSRDRIRSIPLHRYVLFRDWLVSTTLEDAVSGRVFEYLWMKIFTGLSVVCPDMRVCYCDGYGFCFEDEMEFDYWFEVAWKKRQAQRRLDEWLDMVERIEMERKSWWWSRRGRGRKGVGVDLEVPAVDGDIVLGSEIAGYKVLLEEMRLNALKAGTDPRVRARIAGRVWKDGDGY